MNEEEVKRVVLGLKDCLRESHIACEKCSPGFNDRMREMIRREQDELRREIMRNVPSTSRQEEVSR
jgi:hypothetical protein